MDDQERARILQEAYDTLDRCERDQAERAAQIEQLGVSNTPSKHRKPRSKKTYEPELQAAPTMDAATLARWEAWWDERFARAIQKQLEDFAGIIGEETAQREKVLLTEIKTLRAIVDELIVLRSDNAKDITPLKVVHG